MRELATLRLGAKPDAIAPDGTLRAPAAGAGGRQPRAFRIARRRRFARGDASDRRGNLVFPRRPRPDAGAGSARRRASSRSRPALSLTIPLGTAFQFRAIGEAPLTFLAITMPPWPGAEEADRVEGRWTATVAAP